MTTKRIDVLSDTHGRLTHEVLEQLDGCDLIIHAGDNTSQDDFITLRALAPLRMCLGNNDWSGEYGPDVIDVLHFEYEGLNFCVSHYRERLVRETFDVGIFGHTHVPVCERSDGGALLMNPGSPTYPRSEAGPTMGRILIADGVVASAEIVPLKSDHKQARGRSSGTTWGRNFFLGQY